MHLSHLLKCCSSLVRAVQLATVLALWPRTGRIHGALLRAECHPALSVTPEMTHVIEYDTVRELLSCPRLKPPRNRHGVQPPAYHLPCRAMLDRG